ncbi:hypothetical protein L1987_84138 [Smallanthus sonchifolius]|uniref:Uncharacterized protein n=1 Tax=Smallanthus sonchifolius TaxID=185202 RepID=A0ACB8YFC2_9ASTR|nr:hypothetical protein L1987_84138 [Smallanthus sonchifolius]
MHIYIYISFYCLTRLGKWTDWQPIIDVTWSVDLSIASMQFSLWFESKAENTDSVPVCYPYRSVVDYGEGGNDSVGGRLDCGNDRSVDAGKWIRKHNRFELQFDSVVGGFIGEFLLREPAGGGRNAIGVEEG